jgi:hypothetical protein
MRGNILKEIWKQCLVEHESQEHNELGQQPANVEIGAKECTLGDMTKMILLYA